MLNDPFKNTVDSSIAPAERCFAIDTDDFANLEMATKAIYVGQGGDLAVIPLKGSGPVLFKNVASGAILDLRVRAVMATGTTADSIVGLA